jgi:hypothetical protein
VKKKVRKFASGGDIITGLGAVLIGKALYDKYKGKDDDDKAKLKYDDKGSVPTDKSDYSGKNRSTLDSADAAERKRAEDASKGRPELIPEDDSGKADEATMRSDNYPSRKPVVKTTPKKAASAAKKTTPAAPAAKKAEPAPKSVVFKPAEDSKKAESPVSKKAESPVKLALPSNSKPDLSTPKGFDMKGTNKTAYGTDTTSVFQKKAAQERAEAEEKAKKKAREQANIRSGESERMMRDSLGSGFKRGGTVKKYASGGSVSSASKRADGIAQRGKTRGRVC